jgi:hypothetical protein
MVIQKDLLDLFLLEVIDLLTLFLELMSYEKKAQNIDAKNNPSERINKKTP